MIIYPNKRRLISVEILRSVVLVSFIILYLYHIAFGINPMIDSIEYSSEAFWLVFPKYLTNMTVGLMAFIFSLSAVWAASIKLRNNESYKSIFSTQLKFLLFFSILELIYSYFFAPSSKLPYSEESSAGILFFTFNDGKFIIPSLDNIFFTTYFIIIGFSSFFTVSIFLILHKFRKKYYNSVLHGFTLLAFSWLIFLEIRQIEFLRLSEYYYYGEWYHKILSFFLYNWGAKPFPLSSIIPYSLFGAILGYKISIVKEAREYRQFSILYIVSFFGFFAYYIGTDFIASRLGEHVTTQWDFIFQNNTKIFTFGNLMVQYALMLPLFRYYDLPIKVTPRQQNILFNFFRELGRMSLTVVMTIPLVGIFFYTILPGLEDALFFGISLLLWFLLLFFWYCINFMGNLEQILLRIYLLLFKRKISKDEKKEILKNADLVFFYFDPKINDREKNQ